MISIESAQNKILQATRRLGTHRVPIGRALGCVLAERIRAKDAVPLFDNSAVDGFAVRATDVASATQATPVRLALQYTIRAGDAPGVAIKKGHAVKVLTGAPVPPGTTAVVMKEFVLEHAEHVSVVQAAKKESGVRRGGGEFVKGQIVFTPGIIVTPPVIGMLATLGYSAVKVSKPPRVSIVVTGNELRSPSSRLKPGEIRDSNSYALAAALRAMGIEPVAVAHARDTEVSVREVIIRVLKRSDVVITVGGVSVGEYDYVKDVLADLGVTKHFWSVAMRPGKPNYFGTHGKKLVFGLPGNPVSALVSFVLLVKPALMRLMGRIRPVSLMKAVLMTELTKKPGRTDFVRGVMTWDIHDELTVTPTTGQDSHMVGGLAAANCLIVFPAPESRLRRGSIVSVMPLEW